MLYLTASSERLSEPWALSLLTKLDVDQPSASRKHGGGEF